MIRVAARLARVLAPVLAPISAPTILLIGCSAAGTAPPLVQRADSPVYRCPGGASFTRQFDPTTHQTDLFPSGGGVHRLDPVPDPLGGVVYQDADYQLRPTASDRVFALTDRSTTARTDCTR